MDLQSYLEFTPTVALYPKENEMMYLGMGLASEAGEFVGKVAKIWRGDKTLEGMKEKMAQELGDIMWFCSQLQHRFEDVDLSTLESEMQEIFVDCPIEGIDTDEQRISLLSALAGEIYELGGYYLQVYNFTGEQYSEVLDIAKHTLYCAAILGYSMEDILEFNYTKLTGRKSAGTLQGDGDGINDRH